MKLQTIQYKKEKGWSQPCNTQMDSKNTVLFLFGAPSFISEKKNIRRIKVKVPTVNSRGLLKLWGNLWATNFR